MAKEKQIQLFQQHGAWARGPKPSPYIHGLKGQGFTATSGKLTGGHKNLPIYQNDPAGESSQSQLPRVRRAEQSPFPNVAPQRGERAMPGLARDFQFRGPVDRRLRGKSRLSECPPYSVGL